MKTNKGLKGLIGLICIIYCFLLFIKPNVVKADIIWEPQDDFYEKHMEECVYEGRRRYTSNHEDGSVTIYKSPKSKVKVGTYTIEEGYYVQYTYIDKKGVKWGVLSLEGKTGWCRMSGMTLIYDFQSFHEDYQHKYEKYNGEYDDILLKPFLLWTFPGSGQIEANFKEFESMPVIEVTYRDDENRLWGKVDYYLARHGWICLDDPVNEDILEFGKHTLIESSSDRTDIENNLAENISREWIIPVTMVVALVTITAIMIRVLYKKRSTK